MQTDIINQPIFWAVPAASVVALAFAAHFYRRMKQCDEGTPTMREIARHVRSGAMAYLKQQYKIVGIVFVALAILFAVLAVNGLQNPVVPVAFLTGGFFSGLAGFFGMKTATYASARTANAASTCASRVRCSSRGRSCESAWNRAVCGSASADDSASRVNNRSTSVRSANANISSLVEK